MPAVARYACAMLYPANSLFSSGYLTTDGNAPDADHQLIADAGFEVAAEVPAE